MNNNKTILILSVPLIALVIVVSLVGIYSPHFYAAETLNWQLQTKGQDIIDLYIVIPCLLASTWFAYRKNKIAAIVWGGCVSYLAYSFTIYCFSIHFNRLFIPYCLCFGLSLYSTIYFLIAEYKKDFFFKPGKNAASPYIGVYFILIAVLFYILWLSEIIPANLQNITTDSLKQTGLFTNAVHVLDLAIFLPAIIIAGTMLLRRSIMGFILSPMLLVFIILMDITISFLQYLMKIKGWADNLGVMYIMLSLAAISLVLLILFFRDSKPATAS